MSDVVLHGSGPADFDGPLRAPQSTPDMSSLLRMNPSTLSTSVIHNLQNVILASSDDAPSDSETEENPGAVHVSTPLQGDSGGTDYFDGASIWGTDEDWSWNDAMAALDVPFEPQLSKCPEISYAIDVYAMLSKSQAISQPQTLSPLPHPHLPVSPPVHPPPPHHQPPNPNAVLSTN